MKIQKLASSKLFYNKWPYKIECRIVGANRLRWSEDGSGNYSGSLSKAEKSALLIFAANMKPFLKLKDQLQIRIERRCYNIFCKDPVLLEKIYNAVEPHVVRVSGPSTDEELNYMLDNGHKKILRDRLPKNGYRYKIYFKGSWNKEDRKKFLEWAIKNTNVVDISKSSKNWLEGNYKWMYNPFIYVKNSQTMTMVGLYASGYVNRVEEFILRSSINTCQDQEQVCQHSVSA